MKSIYCFGANPNTDLVIGPILSLMTLVISFSIAVFISDKAVSFEIPLVIAVLFKVLTIISFISTTSSGVIIFNSSTVFNSLPLSFLVSIASSKLPALTSSICLAVSLSIEVVVETKSFGK